MYWNENQLNVRLDLFSVILVDARSTLAARLFWHGSGKEQRTEREKGIVKWEKNNDLHTKLIFLFIVNDRRELIA